MIFYDHCNSTYICSHMIIHESRNRIEAESDIYRESKYNNRNESDARIMINKE